MYPNIEDVTRVLEHMEHLSSSEKTHLAAIFDSLKNRQEDLFDNLKKEIKSELQRNEQEKIDIYTALVEPDMKKELKEYNFFEICEGINPLEQDKININNREISCLDQYFCGIVFWKDTYESMQERSSENFKAKMLINNDEYEVTYRFRSTDVYINKEKEIHRIAIQYGIEMPIIYNPMARRAIEVLIKFPCDITKRDLVSIDFCLAENGLRDSILLNRFLVWNVSKKGCEELPDAKTGEYKEVLPLWDYTFLTYRFSVKNKNPCVKDFLLITNELRAIKRVGDDIYWQLKDAHSEMIYDKYSIYLLSDAAEKKLYSQIEYLYHNKYEIPALGEIERIRTKADVMRVVSGFNSIGINCRAVFSENDSDCKDVIYTYPKRMDYYQVKDERLKSARRCKVQFDVDDNDKMYVDKISYVISYLNHRYPEYRWIGVK